MGDKKIYRVDIDGTLCNKTYGHYEKAVPILDHIAVVNGLYDAGNKIIIWTQRKDTFCKDYKELTRKQLKEWGVKYHVLSFDKPYFDVIFDDKAECLNDYKLQMKG